MNAKPQLVIVGNGMAPGRMLEHLFEAYVERYEVIIFNAEPRVNYNRLMLSPVPAGEKTYEDIITHNDDWYEQHGVTLYKNMRIEDIDTTAKTVTAAHGTAHAYDKLVLETGSIPFVPPIPGR